MSWVDPYPLVQRKQETSVKPQVRLAPTNGGKYRSAVSTIEEIERVIEKLPRADFERLSA